jgi:acetyl-CoA C-acetyltransferase/acetyl-CoA acyltransferase
VLVVTTQHNSDRSEKEPVEVVSTGYHHPPSHFFGARGRDLSELPAANVAMSEALDAADIGAGDLDVFEPYAPFPHIEAILTEELGVFERGEGVAACVRSDTATDGTFPVSPSGGCLGRGHPAMVTPLLNYLAAVRQIRGTAPNQVSNVEYALTTAEHGHVDGVNATVFRGGA